MKYLFRFIGFIFLLFWCYIMIPLFFAIFLILTIIWTFRLKDAKEMFDQEKKSLFEIVVDSGWTYDEEGVVCSGYIDYYLNPLDWLLKRNKQTR